MSTMDRRSLCLAAGALAAPLQVSAASAQDWPAKPVRLLVPFAAGTTTDSLARILGQHLSRTLGQPVVVDNRSGAGGNVGVAAAAKSPPDGYTLVLGTSGTHGVNASLYRDPGFDPVRDFAPVAPFLTAPAVLAVRAASARAASGNSSTWPGAARARSPSPRPATARRGTSRRRC